MRGVETGALHLFAGADAAAAATAGTEAAVVGAKALPLSAEALQWLALADVEAAAKAAVVTETEDEVVRREANTAWRQQRQEQLQWVAAADTLADANGRAAAAEAFADTGADGGVLPLFARRERFAWDDDSDNDGVDDALNLDEAVSQVMPPRSWADPDDVDWVMTLAEAVRQLTV